MERFWAPVHKTSSVIYCRVREAELRKGDSPKSRIHRAQTLQSEEIWIGLSVEKNLQKDITIQNLNHLGRKVISNFLVILNQKTCLLFGLKLLKEIALKTHIGSGFLQISTERQNKVLILLLNVILNGSSSQVPSHLTAIPKTVSTAGTHGSNGGQSREQHQTKYSKTNAYSYSTMTVYTVFKGIGSGVIKIGVQILYHLTVV